MTIELSIFNHQKLIKHKPLKNNKKQFINNNFYYYQNTYKKKKNKKIINRVIFNRFNHISTNLKFTKSIYKSITIYHTKTIDKFLNYFVKKGKKSIAEYIFYNLIFLLRKKTKRNPFNILYKGLLNSRPSVDVKTMRQRGRSLDIPKMIKLPRRFFLAVKWLIKSSKTHKKYLFFQKLYLEIINSVKRKGNSIFTKKLLMKKAVAGRVNQKFRAPYIKQQFTKNRIYYYIDIKKSLSTIEGSYKNKFVI